MWEALKVTDGDPSYPSRVIELDTGDSVPAGGGGFADLEVDDQVGSGSAPHTGKVSVLLRWNAADPPSTFELRRNDVIHVDSQGNLNPFIDHPEWADSIW